jgi:plastocyanin
MRPHARPNRRAFPSSLLRDVLFLLTSLGAAFPGTAATIGITVQTLDGHALSGAVVTVHAVGASDRPSVPVQAVMDQIDRTFQPDLLVIPVGSTVEFPNSDAVSHQIYSFSAAKRFQLPLYRGKPYPPVHFDQVGLVTLGCNIHDSMLAYVIVTDAPFFGRTDNSGAWSAEVPRGTYRVTVWHPRMRPGEEMEREMMIGEGDRAAFTLRLGKPLEPAPLTTMHHSWDTY